MLKSESIRSNGILTRPQNSLSRWVVYPSVTAPVVQGILVSIPGIGWRKPLRSKSSALMGQVSRLISNLDVVDELKLSRSPAISSYTVAWSGMCDVPYPKTGSVRIDADILEMRGIVATCVGLERYRHLSGRHTTGCCTGFW